MSCITVGRPGWPASKWSDSNLISRVKRGTGSGRATPIDPATLKESDDSVRAIRALVHAALSDLERETVIRYVRGESYDQMAAAMSVHRKRIDSAAAGAAQDRRPAPGRAGRRLTPSHTRGPG